MQLQIKLGVLDESASSTEADLRTAMAEQGKKSLPISICVKLIIGSLYSYSNTLYKEISLSRSVSKCTLKYIRA